MMERMKCPYCHTKVKFFVFQFRLTGYKCPNCQNESKYKSKSKWFIPILVLFGVLGGIVFGMVFEKDPFEDKPGLSFVLTILVGIVLSPVIQFAMILNPVHEDTANETDESSSKSDEVSQ